MSQSDARFEYSTVDIAWTSLSLVLFLFFFIAIYVSITQCECWAPRHRSRHVIRHVIIEPMDKTQV